VSSGHKKGGGPFAGDTPVNTSADPSRTALATTDRNRRQEGRDKEGPTCATTKPLPLIRDEDDEEEEEEEEEVDLDT